MIGRTEYRIKVTCSSSHQPYDFFFGNRKFKRDVVAHAYKSQHLGAWSRRNAVNLEASQGNVVQGWPGLQSQTQSQKTNKRSTKFKMGSTVKFFFGAPCLFHALICPVSFPSLTKYEDWRCKYWCEQDVSLRKEPSCLFASRNWRESRNC